MFHHVSPASRKILEVLVAEAFHKRNLGVVDEKRMGTVTDLQRDSASMDAFLKLKGSLFQSHEFWDDWFILCSFCVQ